MSRLCDAVACERTVGTGRFMCIQHWRLVPQATQREINSRYRAAPNRYALMHDQAYVLACATAVEHIATAEGLATDNSYRRLLGVLQRQAEAS